MRKPLWRGGSCCDPWWGVIFYTATNHDGLRSFKKELADSVRERVERIKTRYVTREDRPRPLFRDPERYHVAIEGIRVNGPVISVSLRAMFAFRCAFLSAKKKCSIHPTIAGSDIRPPHCAKLGSGGARAGEEGYCRVIDAAMGQEGEMGFVNAVELERKTSDRYYGEGCPTIDEISNRVFEEVKTRMGRTNAPGRNEPCFCGSRMKYKKCHGR